MSAIKCCKDCVPPKRYPGCGATCPEYKKEKAEHQKRVDQLHKETQINIFRTSVDNMKNKRGAIRRKKNGR